MEALEGPDICYCFAARRSARAASRLYDAHLVKAGINTSQFSILSLVQRHPSIKISRLAELTVMERTTLVRAMQPLQKAGFVEGRPVVGSRATAFSLTAAGLAKVVEAERFWQVAQSEYERIVGAERAARIREENVGIARG